MTINDVQDKLRVPFTGDQIQVLKKTWTGRDGKEKSIDLTYAQVPAIISRLNEAFGGDWTFEITKDIFEREMAQVLVFGRLRACGVVHDAIGCDGIGQGDESLGDAYKGAVGDAIRLCAKQFGVGLDLWMKKSGSVSTEAPAAANKPNKYKGPCGRCGQEVAVEAGYSQKVGDKWFVFHHDCPTPVTPEPTPEPTPDAKSAPAKAPTAVGATRGTTVTQGSEMYPCSPAQYGFLLACLKRNDLSQELVEQAAFLVDNPTVNLNNADQKQFGEKGYDVVSVPNKLEANNLITAIKAHLAAPKHEQGEHDGLPF